MSIEVNNEIAVTFTSAFGFSDPWSADLAMNRAAPDFIVRQTCLYHLPASPGSVEHMDNRSFIFFRTLIPKC